MTPLGHRPMMPTVLSEAERQPGALLTATPDPLTLSARGYFTNFINRPAGESNPTQTRLQLDALVKF